MTGPLPQGLASAAMGDPFWFDTEGAAQGTPMNAKAAWAPGMGEGPASTPPGSLPGTDR